VSLAMKAAERAVKLDPSLPDAYMVRGAALRMKGDSGAAREDLERAGQAPAELPMFLLGSFYEVLEASGFNHSMMDLLNQYSQRHGQEAGAGTPGPMPGFDPQDVVENMFDDSGNIDDQIRPFLEMAIDNAPSILKNLPPGLLSGLGGLDAEDLEDLDLSEMSSEDIESQMKQVFEMMQSGDNPFEQFDGAWTPDEPDSEDPDDE